MTTVDAWCWHTAHLAPDDVAALEPGLGPDERDRAARFVFPADRRDYVAAHALLRRVLSRHGPHPPDAWAFDGAEGGKPAIVAGQAGEPALRFNLSHARGVVACAVARGADVGIDVEPVGPRERARDPRRGTDEILAAAELAALQALPAGERPARFTELWVLREAWVKGRGASLWTATPEAIQFAFEGPTGLERHGEGEAGAWEFALLTVAHGSCLAVGARLAGTDRRWALAVHVLDGPPAAGLRWTGTLAAAPEAIGSGLAAV
jgi:4'-phosphopantetheinyl transferase